MVNSTAGSIGVFGEVTDVELLAPGFDIGATDGLPWSCGCSATGATWGTTAFATMREARILRSTAIADDMAAVSKQLAVT
jgi:hypothetical protein